MGGGKWREEEGVRSGGGGRWREDVEGKEGEGERKEG